MSSIPPTADRVLIASQLDLEFVQPIWEAALVEADSPSSLMRSA